MAEFFCCCRYILTFYPLNSLMSILLPLVYFLIPCSKCHLTKKIEVEAPLELWILIKCIMKKIPHISRYVFKLVWDFSVAPYKPSDSAQKFDGPLNLASQVREAESLNIKQRQWYYLDSQFITWPLSHVRPDLEVHQISAQSHSVCTELRKSLILIWKRL